MAKITDIHCTQCGAPAQFDIIRQMYLCQYCGGTVGIREALQQKQGYRSMQADKLKKDVSRFELFSATCSGCGATVVFEENEALSNCAFCGRSLVRSAYLNTKNLPESVIPFALTQEEAAQRLTEWCNKNRSKSEARKLRSMIPQLKGFYLPYEMIRGPVHMGVSRMDGTRRYPVEGFLNNEFVNRSRQLDNLLLDGMEPFDIEQLTEFDFSYVAGQRVKISDISDADLQYRAEEEAASAYTPSVRKTLCTKAVDVYSHINDAVRLPVLLPVYYISDGNLMAAVNGQTGKVSVRAEKESHYYFLPWWLKAIVATAAFSGIFYGILRLFGLNHGAALFYAGALALFLIIVTLCLYSDTYQNDFAVEAGRKIYTSGEKTFRRERGGLIQSDKILERKIVEPIFIGEVRGQTVPVTLRLYPPARILKIFLLTFVALFFPVIIASFFTGFDFSRLNLGGSAVWFCIAVPVIPIYLLKFGVVDLRENPWIYYRNASGKLRRYRGEKIKPAEPLFTFKDVLKVMFVPPASLLFWFCVAGFITMIYLTAGGE